MRTIHAVPILFVLLLGCTPAASGSFEPRPTQRFLLTGDEMRRQPYPSTYAAIERLRPWLLHPLRGTLPDLYLDGLRQPIDVLRTLPTDIVVEIRYVHGSEAVRFTGGQNALVLTTLADPSRRR